MKVKKVMKPAAEFAEAHGFTVSLTRGNHLRFTRPGCKSVFAGSTVSDQRAARNVISLLQRSLDGHL